MNRTSHGSSSRRNWQRPLRRGLIFVLLDILVALVAWSWPVLADTSARLEGTSAVCYCDCAESHARAGCAKMCELKKYASRWWATSCARPHQLPSANKSGAGPHLQHPDHAEHAQRF
jgi:hypothetical protein